MEGEIGTIIFRLREQAGYTQVQLCRGICSVSELARMESNQLVPGHFQLDLIFGRLGKSAERLEYVLSKEVYELYELRYQIQTAICHQDFDKAEELLKKYEGKKQAERPLHMQFIEQERAQIAWIKGEDPKKILELLNNAIFQTIPDGKLGKSKNALSAEEIKLLLFRWEVSQKTQTAEPLETVNDFLNYIEQHLADQEERVKVYPYAVLLFGRRCNQTEKRERLIFLTGRALELLRDEGKILFMPEILELYAQLLEGKAEEAEMVQTLRRECRTLLTLEKKVGVSFEKYPLFQHLNREFEMDYELIQKSRMAARIPQEVLCEGICTQETLSRIENGKRSPSNKNMGRLLERLNRSRSRISTVIMAEGFEEHELKRKYAKCIQRLELEKAKEILAELEEMLDCTKIENKQYIWSEKIKIAIMNGSISFEKSMDKLQDILKLTLPDGEETLYHNKLTAIEINILNLIAVLYSTNQRKDEAIKIYRMILRNYEESFIDPVFHICEWQLKMGNLASCLEETGKLDLSMEILEKLIQKSIEIGKGNELGRSLTTMACVLEKKDDSKYKEFFYQAMDMLKLMKVEERYRLVKEYVREKNIVGTGS